MWVIKIIGGQAQIDAKNKKEDGQYCTGGAYGPPDQLPHHILPPATSCSLVTSI